MNEPPVLAANDTVAGMSALPKGMERWGGLLVRFMGTPYVFSARSLDSLMVNGETPTSFLDVYDWFHRQANAGLPVSASIGQQLALTSPPIPEQTDPCPTPNISA